MYQSEAHLRCVSDACSKQTLESETAYVFGPFTLIPRQHVLLNNGLPVVIGNRALSLLVALVSRPGEVVEKSELMALVWPRLVVEECNLRAQVVALRRVLGADLAGDYVLTIPGRGYRFVAPVTVRAPAVEAIPVPAPATRLPSGIAPLIGRDVLIPLLGRQLQDQRFVTLTGAGGIGKSAMALAVANEQAERFAQGVCYLDLAVTSAALIPALLAKALGLAGPLDDPLNGNPERLRDCQLLLVLDNAEYSLETITPLVERLLQEAPHSAVLVTSREALRARGECLHVLAPLDGPPQPVGSLTTTQALDFSAVRLFIERVIAHDPTFVFNVEDIAPVSAICRTLDHLPLAIELAATRVRTFGIRALVGLLNGHFRLQMTGRRNSPERHHSLGAALDWSYSRLSVQEQAFLRQLSVFPGSFSLAAATSIVDGDALGGQSVLPLLESLIDKSLLMPCDLPAARRYRLLETTRAYAREHLSLHGETSGARARRGVYALGVLREASARLNSLPASQWVSIYGPEVELVRVTLKWAFGPGGDQALGSELMSLSVPLWLRMSLTAECHQWLGSGPCGKGASSIEATAGERPRSSAYLWRVFEGILMIREGQLEQGVSQLASVMKQLHHLGEPPLYSLIRMEHAEGLARLEQKHLGQADRIEHFAASF